MPYFISTITIRVSVAVFVVKIESVEKCEKLAIAMVLSSGRCLCTRSSNLSFLSTSPLALCVSPPVCGVCTVISLYRLNLHFCVNRRETHWRVFVDKLNQSLHTEWQLDGPSWPPTSSDRPRIRQSCGFLRSVSGSVLKLILKG